MAVFDKPLGTLADRTSGLRQHVAVADGLALGDPFRLDTMAQIRASAYVWLAAALETFVQMFVAELIDEINGISLVRRDLRLSLFSLASSARLDRLRDVHGLKMWNERAQLFADVDAVDGCVLDLRVKPLDGRTIEPYHLDTIWDVFGLDGSSTPTPLHRLALVDLSANRNKLAHGEEDPVSFGRGRTTNDVRRSIDFVDDTAVHLTAAGAEYLSTAAYRR